MNASSAGQRYKLLSKYTDEVNMNCQGTHRVKHHLTSVLNLYLSRRPQEMEVFVTVAFFTSSAGVRIKCILCSSVRTCDGFHHWIPH